MMQISIHRHAGKAITNTPAAEPLRPAMAPRKPRPAPRHDISGVAIGETVQRKATTNVNGAAYRAPNRTGLPDRLKAGVEARSGVSLDRVRVHTNSDQPAQLNAHAYTKGTDIHIAPGQERHLAHEAWHVVQQAQGRVRPTMSVAGESVNDDAGLEREADSLGAASAAHGAELSADRAANHVAPATASASDACAQRVIEIKQGHNKGIYHRPLAANTMGLLFTVGKLIGDELRPGWKGWIRGLVRLPGNLPFPTIDILFDTLRSRFPKKDTSARIRPGFISSAPRLARITRRIRTGKDQSKLKPSEENLAMPHRFSFDAIKESTDWYITGKENAADLHRWSDRLIKATRQRRDLNASEIADKQEREQYKKEVDRQIDEMENARKNLIDKVEAGNKLTLTSDATQAFLKYANSLHGNIPDYGPHIGVNIQVSNRVHLNVGKAGTITPGSLAALSMTPKRGRGVALTSDGKALVTTGGYKLNLDELSKKLQKLIRERGTDNTTINKDDLMEDDEK